MPEEINRLVTDAITNWFFTTSDVANANLRTAGVAGGPHLLRGQHDDRHAAGQPGPAAPPRSGTSSACSPAATSCVTLHRPANVDTAEASARMLAAIGEGTRGMPVVFPVHPRTAKTLRELAQVPAGLLTWSSRSRTWSSTTW
jgi:UDP-N-acetylglucosamine 2-epimerase (non-hydrolysing)